MAGRNQHHIPQIVQRSFGVLRKGTPVDIWKFTKESDPTCVAIEETAAGHDFYSEPGADGEITLDDKITALEKPIFKKYTTLSQRPIGTTVDANVAADLVVHFASRTSHLRSIFAQGFRRLAVGVTEIFGDQDNLTRMLGLDGDAPTEQFHRQVVPKILDGPLNSVGLPAPVLTRVAFWFLKENFDPAEFAQSAILGFTSILPEVEDRARDGHNKALATILGSTNIRHEDLLTYEWLVKAAPSQGAILPDCVAVSYDNSGMADPYMMADRDTALSIVFPLTRKRLLVGIKPGANQPDLAAFNADAASCSDAFFLAATDDPAHAQLCQTIGERCHAQLENSLGGAIDEFRFPKHELAEAINGDLPTEEAVAHESAPVPTTQFSYQVSLDWADQQTAEHIAEALNPIVIEMARLLPLNRLEGITFAADYPAALAAIDTGVPGVPPPQTVSEEVGTGIAMTVNVIRDGDLKCRIVLASFIGEALLNPQHPAAQMALHTIVHELASVASAEWFEKAFPNMLMRTRWDDPHQGQLLAEIHAGLDGYIAAKISAGFAGDDLIDSYRELLVAALRRAGKLIPEARYAYRFHGDMDQLVSIVYPAVRHILMFAGRLIGHCDGLGVPLWDDEGTLKVALSEASLDKWLPMFQQDLQLYWQARERWASLDELFALNRHFERILWQFGIFPWKTDDGSSRIEIPLITDAQALMAAIGPNDSDSPTGIKDGEAKD